jgi:hypothetical protein
MDEVIAVTLINRRNALLGAIGQTVSVAAFVSFGHGLATGPVEAAPKYAGAARQKAIERWMNRWMSPPPSSSSVRRLPVALPVRHCIPRLARTQIGPRSGSANLAASNGSDAGEPMALTEQRRGSISAPQFASWRCYLQPRTRRRHSLVRAFQHGQCLPRQVHDGVLWHSFSCFGHCPNSLREI